MSIVARRELRGHDGAKYYSLNVAPECAGCRRKGSIPSGQETIDQGVEILTGKPAGVPDEKGAS